MSTTNASIPGLFLSHGSPMLALEDSTTSRFLRSLATEFPKPTAIIVASAHWETESPMVTGSAHPETIHDFRGFPPELYALRYPAPGYPELAERVKSMLVAARYESEIDPVRGIDHGVWNPLLLMYPEADIPVIEVSIQPLRDARWHYHIGQTLAMLREENILIIGTGNLTHNLHEAIQGHHTETPIWVTAFAQWVNARVNDGDIEGLLNWEALAPQAIQNHPTPEHFLPFFITLGAGGKNYQAQHLHEDTALGVLAMDAYAFG